MDIEKFHVVENHHYVRCDDIERIIAQRDEALAKLAAMESQAPYKYLTPLGELRDTCEAFNAHEWGAKFEPLYRKPVPADNPAVAVPDGLIDALKHQWQVDADGAGTGVSRQALDEAIEILESIIASPSHSQHGAPDWENEAKRAFWCGFEIGAGMGAVPILPRWDEYIAKRKAELFDRCPSHESEQGGESTN